VVKSSLTNATRTTKVLRGTAATRAKHAVGSDAIGAFDPTATRVARNPAEAAEAARAAAFQQGYQEGLDAAQAEVAAAMDDANRRVRHAVAALSEAIANFDTRETTAIAAVEDAVVAGAFALAREIVQRELTVMTDPGAEAIARALSLTPQRGETVARLNPADAATLSIDNVDGNTRTLTVVADPSVQSGGCVVEVGDARIDAQLSSALAHVRQALAIDVTAFADDVTSTELVAGSSLPTSRTTDVEAPLP
jgi:flagellar assembly protein FliH